jgi:AbrB family looped-hinge helix DNA binding protein
MTLYASVKVSKRNQIAVPAAARQQLKIRSGDRLIVDIQDGMLILLPAPDDYAQYLSGLHNEIWQGIDIAQYILEERKKWDSSAE